MHSFINDLERPIGTYLYGRRMYETMSAWETPDTIPHRTPAILDFARIWQPAEKIVYSKTLQTVSTAKTRGKPFLPGNVRTALQLLDQRGFDNGIVHIRCGAKNVEPLPGRPS